jgi:pseudouridine kinase
MLEGMKDYWLIVGGANVDIKGESSDKLLLGTSNPGTVRLAAGGVGRNVAENLARLGEEVQLFALVGEDTDGEWLRQTTAQSGVATNGMFRVPGHRTGSYLAIYDSNGEMITAVADMAVNEAWDEQMIQSGLKQLSQAVGLFIDANVPTEVIKRFLEEGNRLGLKVVVDPVSVKKAEKWRGLLEGVSLIAPSIDEAEVLTGALIKSQRDIEDAAALLQAQGVGQVMITCGAKGVYIRGPKDSVWLPAPQTAVRDVNGEGDAFTAGVMFAFSLTDSLVEQAAYGIALAGLVLSGQSSATSAIDRTVLIRAKDAYLEQARHAFG